MFKTFAANDIWFIFRLENRGNGLTGGERQAEREDYFLAFVLTESL